MSWLSTIIAGSISGLLVLWIWTKYQNWNDVNEKDRASIRIMEVALRLLPEEEREYYHEDWFMFLCDIDCPTDRLKHAIGYLKAAASINVESRVLVPAQSLVKIVKSKISSAEDIFSVSFIVKLRFYLYIFSEFIEIEFRSSIIKIIARTPKSFFGFIIAMIAIIYYTYGVIRVIW